MKSIGSFSEKTEKYFFTNWKYYWLNGKIANASTSAEISLFYGIYIIDEIVQIFIKFVEKIKIKTSKGYIWLIFKKQTVKKNQSWKWF